MAKGCPEMCHHCGNYEILDEISGSTHRKILRESLVIREFTREQIDAVLRLCVDDQGAQLSSFLAPIVTTGIGSEVLRADNFNYLTNRVFESSKGKSRMILITHGIHADNSKMIERFRESVELAIKDVLAGIIVTLDQQRHRFRSRNPKLNIDSYAATLELLRPVLASRSDARISFSIQGDDQYDTIDGIDSALDVFRKSLRAADLTSKEFSRLHVNLRGYSSKGRAKVFVPDDHSVACAVIPDPDFERTIDRSNRWRGWVDFYEKDLESQNIMVKVRENNPGCSYDDLAEKDGWEEIEFDG